MKRSQIFPFCFILFLSTLLFFLYQLRIDALTASAQKDLAANVVRFHVLAESNSSEDQRLKLLVKSAVLEYMEEPLARASSAEEAISILNKHTNDIVRIASDVLKENNSSLTVCAETKETYFPEKTYGDITFPAGIYTAYQILLGTGSGQNWWCVLYPPLCFLDVTHAVVPEESKAQLKSFLTQKEYNLITNSLEEYPIEFRFRLFDWITS